MGKEDRQAIFSQEPNGHASDASKGAGVKSGESQFVTVDQFQELKTEVTEGLERVARETQGLVDKNASRIEATVQQQLSGLDTAKELLKAAGHEIPDDVIERAGAIAVTGAFTSKPKGKNEQPAASNNQASPEQPSGQGEQQEQVTGDDPISILAAQKMAKAGVQILDTDPEYKMVDMVTEDALVFLESVDKAIAAKAERVGGGPPEITEGDPNAAQKQRWLQSPSGGMTGGSSSSNIPDLPGEALLEMHYDEADRNARG